MTEVVWVAEAFSSRWPAISNRIYATEGDSLYSFFFSILQTCVKFQVIYPGCTDYIPEVKIVIAQSSRSFETATCTIHLKSLVTLPGLHFLNIAFLIRLFPYRLPTSNTYNPLQLKLSWFIRLVPVVRVYVYRSPV